MKKFPFKELIIYLNKILSSSQKKTGSNIINNYDCWYGFRSIITE